MTVIVPVVTGGADLTSVTGPQYGVKYELVGPDGCRAVFNDTTDRDYVGVLSEITGLDSPEVRESADNLVGMDGGIHGNFYYGRRPITMSGVIPNVTSATDRNIKMSKLERATNAMREDASLTWTPSGGEEQRIWIRRQQPLRISGGWAKEFQIAMVAADARIYSSTLYSSQVVLGTGSPPSGYAAQSLITNNGNAETPAIITLVGPMTNPIIYNMTNGGVLALAISISAGDYITIDTLNHTAVLNNITSVYSTINFTTARWFFLDPGQNDLRITTATYTSPAQLAALWRAAWV